MSGIDLPGELARVQAEIARLEAVAASRPHDPVIKRLLGWEQAHAERVKSTMAAAGLAVE